MTLTQELKNVIKQAEETLEELYENIEEMKNRLEEMELEEKWEQEQKTIYNLEKGDTYWFIDGFIPFLTFWKDNSTDIAQLTHGNIYLTEQDAKDEIKARKLIAKAKKSQKGFKPDWEKDDEEKHYLYYNHYLVIETSTYTHNVPTKLGYWSDFYDMRNFVNENKEDLIWFFTEYTG
ncbi:hypothetical protein [Microaceticoccus formicicus]|uniref:hypothetical protein n=1 Tax=Microaceticoccus formicicus TaxID=3118105 RepID=UPI003CD01156|nr:hypothetical protein VZL98_04910 [Peptoniphilaceae bacterium AMB_02]